jgi:hypothetical protein
VAPLGGDVDDPRAALDDAWTTTGATLEPIAAATVRQAAHITRSSRRSPIRTGIGSTPLHAVVWP